MDLPFHNRLACNRVHRRSATALLLRVHPSFVRRIPPKKVCYDDCTPLLQTWTHDHEKLIEFWIINVLGIVTGIVFELSLLMYTAVRSAVRVSWSLDLRSAPRLVPCVPLATLVLLTIAFPAIHVVCPCHAVALSKCP